MKIKCSGCGAEHWLSDMQLTDIGCNVVCPNCSTTNFVNTSMIDPMSLEPRWYYAVGEETVGPLSTRDLEFSFQNGQLTQDSLVWCEGFGDWMALSAVQELYYLFSPVQGSSASDEATRVAGVGSAYSGFSSPNLGNGEETAAIDISEWNDQQDIFSNNSNGIVGMDGREAVDDEPVFDMNASSAPSANDMAGARSENSVLFSLSSLQAVGASLSGGGASSSPAAGSNMPAAGGAGLVDVKALAAAPVSRRRTNEVVDSFGGTAVPMATVLPLGNKKDNTPLYIGLGIGGGLVLIIIVLLVVLVANSGNNNNNNQQQAPVDANQMLAKDDGLGVDVAAEQNKKAEEEAKKKAEKAEEEHKADEEEKPAAEEETKKEEAPVKKDTTTAKKDTTTTTQKKDTTTTTQKKDTTTTTQKKDTTTQKKDTKKDTAPTPAPAGNALMKAEISAAMRGAGGQLRTCGRTAAQSGTMKVSFVIKGNGSVANAKCVSPEYANTPTASCVLKVISGVKFRATGGADVPINNYPVAIQK
ncbi:MAG: DUF4339 domain-containing protein [Proteobacteria bacterium]|nr:DUF4339 domain-containing protein [Pseudomonadota bacterium]